MPEGLLLVVWSSIGLWVVGWVGLWVQSFYFAMGWVGLDQSFGGLGWVEEIGPTDNSGSVSLTERRSKPRKTVRTDLYRSGFNSWSSLFRHQQRHANAQY